MSLMQDERLTIDAAAQLLQIEPATVQAWLERGLLYASDDDGAISIQRRDLDSFLAQEGQGVTRDTATET
jgi:hypothetical protein